MVFFNNYASYLSDLLTNYNWNNVYKLAKTLQSAWKNKNQVFLCGNGGSAANAMHFSNDLIFGVSPGDEKGISAIPLNDNQSIMTCISNDLSYDKVFSYQLSVLGKAEDILIVFSGSGNSPNVVDAVKKAKQMDIKTIGVLGFSGGLALELVDIPIHFPINDMQISEDCQQIVGHMIMRWLKENPV